MKVFSSIGIIILSLFMSCGPGNMNEEKQYTGTIKPTGITSYQYGTHTLETNDDFYALRSDVLDLSNYEGMRVIIQATEIEGYPVDGGPVYLNVKKVEK